MATSDREPLLAQLDVAILCGGLGTRLRSVVHDRSKVVAEVGGAPFLSFVLRDLRAAGLRRAILCTGYQADSVRAALGSAYEGLALEYSQEQSPLGTGGALAQAAQRVTGALLLAMNGDSRCAVDYGAMLAQHLKSGAAATIAVCEVADAAAFGKVALDADQRVRRFAEKGASGPGFVNAGIYLLPTAWLREIQSGQPVSLERELLPAWLGRQVGAFIVPGPLLDIGTPESYAQARARAASAS